MSTNDATGARRPGRPRTFEFGPDETLTESELRIKHAILKRRERQNRSYHRRKLAKARGSVQDNPTSNTTETGANCGDGAKASPIESATCGTAFSQQAQAQARHVYEEHGGAVHSSDAFQSEPGLAAGVNIAASAVACAPVADGISSTQACENAAITASQRLSLGAQLPCARVDHGESFTLAQPSLALEHTTNRQSGTMEVHTGTDSSGAELSVHVSGEPQQHTADVAQGPVPCINANAGDDPEENELLGIPGANTDQSGPAGGERSLALVATGSGNGPSVPFAAVEQVAVDLTEVVAQQTELLRMTSIRQLVFENLRRKFSMLPSATQTGLKSLVLFPACFDSKAACAVMGSFYSESEGANALNELLKNRFIEPSESSATRYRLNEIARTFIADDLVASSAPALEASPDALATEFTSEESAGSSALTSTDPVQASFDYAAELRQAEERFRGYFVSRMEDLQNEDLHKIGWVREKAMAFYDAERKNLDFARHLCEGESQDALRAYLASACTVMRYCISARDRQALLRAALNDDAGYLFQDPASFLTAYTGNEESEVALGGARLWDPGAASAGIETESQKLLDLPLLGSGSIATNVQCAGGVPDGLSSGPAFGAQNLASGDTLKARLELALAESYFDELRDSDGQGPLQRAIRLMTQAAEASRLGPLDTVLTLLLTAQMRMRSDSFVEARQLCVRALKLLQQNDLSKSTFAINAMTNLVDVYMAEGKLHKAEAVATKLVDVLNEMRYTDMPIYADALGVRAVVALRMGKPWVAERQFAAALETVGRWSAKSWSSVAPVEHCVELDIWLMEGLSEAMAAQGRTADAERLRQRATSDRIKRGLSMDPFGVIPRGRANVAGGGVDGKTGTWTNGGAAGAPAKLWARHLY